MRQGEKEMNLKKGDIVDIEIIDMSSEGKAIGKSNGLVVFADRGVYGEVVRVELTKVKKNYALGRYMNTLKKSPHLREAKCKNFYSCGGCSYMDISYEAQLELKRKQLIDKLKRIGDVKEPKVRDFDNLDEESMYFYRNKTSYEITTFGNIKRKGGIIENLGETTIGFKQRGSNKVVHAEDCLIQSPAARAAIRATKEFMVEDNITAYDEKWNQGLMKNMVVRTSEATWEVMVNYVINAKGIPNAEKLVRSLDEAIFQAGYSLESVNISNKKKDDESFDIYGKEIKTIAGKPIIQDRLDNLKFEVSPRSFYQINPRCTKKLYDKVVEYCQLTGDEVVLDLYCGVGSIGLFCADRAKYVVGIESVKDAILNANRNATINGIVNIRFVEGKAEEELPKLLSQEGDEMLRQLVSEAKIVILDPPRAGCEKNLLDEIANTVRPDKIVYVSCDPATLARDIKILKERGYDFVEATSFDMFVFSHHIETVALLSKID